MKECCQIFYEGRVQGVGFRFTVKQIATGYEVTGFVRNLADGRVELQAAGEGEEVDEFLEGIRSSVLASHIAREERQVVQPVPVFRGFTITA